MAATTSPYNPKVRVAAGNLTLAQLNAASGAGTVIVKGVPGRTIKVVDVWMRNVGSNVGGCTAIVLEDTAGTDVMSTTRATFDSNVLVRAGISGTTVTNLGAACGKHEGLRIGRTVSDVTTMTGMDYVVKYIISG
jgi:hypothetical protein